MNKKPHKALQAHQDAIAQEISFWLRCTLDPDHAGAPGADRIVGVYMLADIASALHRIADRLEGETR